MFRQLPRPDSKWLRAQPTPQPISTGQIRTEKPEQCYQWGKPFFIFNLPPSAVQQQRKILMEDWHKDHFLMNLMFILQIQNSQSVSFIYFKLLQVSAMVQASQSGSKCWEYFKIKSCNFFSSNKNISMCFNTHSDELNMQTSRLPRRLMDYITYGFFKSNKNKANQKVHPTQKRKNSIPVFEQRYCPC